MPMNLHTSCFIQGVSKLVYISWLVSHDLPSIVKTLFLNATCFLSSKSLFFFKQTTFLLFSLTRHFIRHFHLASFVFFSLILTTITPTPFHFYFLFLLFLNKGELSFSQRQELRKSDKHFHRILSLRIWLVIATCYNGSSREHINLKYIPRALNISISTSTVCSELSWISNKYLAPLLGRVMIFTCFSTKRFFFFVAGYRFWN